MSGGFRGIWYLLIGSSDGVFVTNGSGFFKIVILLLLSLDRSRPLDLTSHFDL